MAVETLSNITQDEVEYARLSNLIKSELDWRTGLFEARQSGREEGEEIGIEKGMEKEKLIIAKNLLSKGSLSDILCK